MGKSHGRDHRNVGVCVILPAAARSLARHVLGEMRQVTLLVDGNFATRGLSFIHERLQ